MGAGVGNRRNSMGVHSDIFLKTNRKAKAATTNKLGKWNSEFVELMEIAY